MLIGAIIAAVGGFIYNKHSGKSRAENHKEVIKGQEDLSGKIDSSSNKIINEIKKDIKPAASQDALENEKKAKRDSISNSQVSQAKNQIINNAPNQGVQINENHGTVVVPKPLARDFTIKDAKKILNAYPTTYPIEIWLKGTTNESRLLYDKVVGSFQQLGYSNISRNVVAIYINSKNGKKENEKDLEWKEENGKLIVSIYPQE